MQACAASTSAAKAQAFGAARKPVRGPSRSLVRPVAALGRDGRSPMDASKAMLQGAGKALAAAALAASLSLAASPDAMAWGPWNGNGLSTKTSKQGVGAKIEASDISQQSAASVVDELKNKILPEATEKMKADASGEGSSYPASVIKELQTVKSEIEALEAMIAKGSDESVVKSTASGIEQQLNGLKAMAGFD